MQQIIELRPWTFPRESKKRGRSTHRSIQTSVCQIWVFVQVYSWSTAPDSDIVKALPSTFISLTTLLKEFTKPFLRLLATDFVQVATAELRPVNLSNPTRGEQQAAAAPHHEVQLWKEKASWCTSRTAACDTRLLQKQFIKQWYVCYGFCLAMCAASYCCYGRRELELHLNKVGGSRKGWSHACRLQVAAA